MEGNAAEKVKGMMQSLQAILKITQQEGKDLGGRKIMQVDVEAAKISAAAESLLRIVETLKETALLEDAKEANRNVQRIENKLRTMETRVDEEFQGLREDIGKMMVELETKYYTTKGLV
mmetsp:Transcript_7097/g.43917  ORF Transcript_7097/g.43917 Transcript_7097/m.43917 type:complete len:119 (-) Transcript_7097:1318-1674(-)|eukprot:CAMPEP_0183824250 /NCGR_PEP_ID=MMETSP0807_2-20130328/484_1 /TAXON_ID=88271 /ORGANISM="Picocystis salinarum, Strain CCMP1897" /LENGTH=118 /DNA_ID=CAMNT_0026069169 /DNA_START=132 /DNA_END=488 /DNA_ORIENTATION=-